jgi:hypothetical protein
LFSGAAEKGLTKTFLLKAEGLTAGVYFTRLVTGTQVLTQRLVLVK